MKLQKHIKEIVISLLVISFTGIWYAAVSTATSWGTLTATMWNDMKAVVDSNEAKLSEFTDSSWSIWIGTSSPIWKLNIEAATDNFLRFSDSGTLKAVIWIDDGGSLVTGVADGDLVIRSEQWVVFWWAGWGHRITINSSWDVWIWTSSPSVKLDVNGTVKATDFDMGYEIVSNSTYQSNWANWDVSVACPTWKKVTWWWCYGSRVNAENNSISRDYPTGNGRYCYSQSSTTNDLTLTAYAICMTAK